MFKTNLQILLLMGLSFGLYASSDWAGDFEDGLRLSMDGNYSSAAISYKKAAERGNPEAQFNLALMYEEGRGVTKDYRLAAMWYLKAAEQDHTQSQHMIGKLLFEGQGTSQDKIEGYKWLSIANDKSKRFRKGKLSEFASKMTTSQIKEAELRKGKWVKAHEVGNLPPKQSPEKSGLR